MNKISDVRTALVQAYLDTGIALPTVYDNDKLRPDYLQPFAILQFLPASPSVSTLGSNGRDELLGILQIDICCPVDQGESVLLEYADTLRAYFTAGRQFEFDSQCVIVSNCGQSQGFTSNNYYRMPISVTWYSRLTRNTN